MHIMVDITYKYNTLRKAVAQATVRVSRPETIQAIREGRVPKGDVFAMAKAAGLFAAKRTADMIPDCHPLPIEYTDVRYEVQELDIRIEVEVHTIYKTGVEVEAMHAASVVALTMYDMLKPLDKGVTIEQIRLLEKKGGKTDYQRVVAEQQVRAAVVVCSDSISRGEKEDRAGKAVIEQLQAHTVPVDEYRIIPDEVADIQQAVRDCQQQGIRLLVFSGGTGLSPRDVTPEALLPLLDRRIPGIEEAIRQYGQQRTPYAMLSRSVAGLVGEMLVLALPGSTNGARESMQAVFPALLHVFRVMEALRHD